MKVEAYKGCNFKNFVSGTIERWEIKKADTGVIVKEMNTPYDNLVVDSGLDKLSTGSLQNSTSNCSLGTGTTAPAVTDTQLESRVGTNIATGTNSNITIASMSPYSFSETREYSFSAGVADSVPLTELGFSNSFSGAYTLFSRVLIKDNIGTPVSITLLPDEVFTVTYTVTKHIPSGDSVGSFDVSGTTHNYTLRVSRATVATSWGTNTDVGSGAIAAVAYEGMVLGSEDSTNTFTDQESITRSSVSTYIPGSFQISESFSLGVTGANFSSGINGFSFLSNSGGVRYQMSFSPAIMKTSAETLILDDFITYSWGRGVS